MTFNKFFHTVDNMVEQWKPDDPQAGATPRDALRIIWEQVREGVVHELAEKQRERDEKTSKTLYKLYTEGKL